MGFSILAKFITSSKNKGDCILWHSGCGKGFVDAMMRFGVKEPLRKAVIRENLFYSNASDIYDFLMEYFCEDIKKHYF